MSTLRLILLDLGIPEDCVSERALLRTDLKLDSTETVEVALEIKRRFGISLTFESRSDLSLADVCTLIDQAVRAAKPGVADVAV